MAVKKKSAQRIKKEAYWFRLIEVAGKYKNALFVDSDNVSSRQISNLRKRLRAIDAYMIMGKNVSNCTMLGSANIIECPPPLLFLSRNYLSSNHDILSIL